MRRPLRAAAIDDQKERFVRISVLGRSVERAAPGSWAGTRTTGVVRRDRSRVLDVAARGSTGLERLPDEIGAGALARLTTILT